MKHQKTHCKKWRQYLSILLSSALAMIIRILAGCNIIEINSVSFLIITPAVVSYIPFLIDRNAFLNSISKTVFFPLISLILFLGIAVATSLGDIIYLIIIGSPFIVISAIVSLMIRGLILKWIEKN